MLYASPIVDRPNALTTSRLMRRPSPDFTTALATRNATTTRSTLEFAKPANALAGSTVPVSTTAPLDGSTVPVSTTAPTASTEAVRSGNALTMTEKIAPAKTAKRCQASLVSPAGIGENQIPRTKGTDRACLPDSAKSAEAEFNRRTLQQAQ